MVFPYKLALARFEPFRVANRYRFRAGNKLPAVAVKVFYLNPAFFARTVSFPSFLKRMLCINNADSGPFQAS